MNTGKIEKNKVRVLQFVNTLELGGATDYALTLCENIDNRVFESYVATGPGMGWKERAQACSKELLILDSMKPSHTNQTDNTVFGDFKSLLTLIKFLRKNEIDVIHTHGSKSRLLGGVAGFIARTPLRVQSAHGFAFNSQMPKFKWGMFYLAEKLMGWLHHLLVLESEYDFSLAEKRRLGSTRKVVYTGIDFSVVKPTKSVSLVRAELGVAADSVVVTMIGRLTEQKDPLTFIETARQVSQKHPDVSFLIVGDGDLDQVARERAHGLDNVHFLGRRTDVYDLLNASDVYMLCSRWEGIPLTILMAQFLAKPIIGTNKLGIPEVVVEGVTGLLSGEGNIMEFASAVERLVESGELRETLGNNGRAMVEERHEINGMIGSFESIYREYVVHHSQVQRTVG